MVDRSTGGTGATFSYKSPGTAHTNRGGGPSETLSNQRAGIGNATAGREASEVMCGGGEGGIRFASQSEDAVFSGSSRKRSSPEGSNPSLRTTLQLKNMDIYSTINANVAQLAEQLHGKE